MRRVAMRGVRRESIECSTHDLLARAAAALVAHWRATLYSSDGAC